MQTVWRNENLTLEQASDGVYWDEERRRAFLEEAIANGEVVFGHDWQESTRVLGRVYRYRGRYVAVSCLAGEAVSAADGCVRDSFEAAVTSIGLNVVTNASVRVWSSARSAEALRHLLRVSSLPSRVFLVNNRPWTPVSLAYR